MGIGGEELLQGAAGITRVRVQRHFSPGETLAHLLVLALGASVSGWLFSQCKGLG